MAQGGQPPGENEGAYGVSVLGAVNAVEDAGHGWCRVSDGNMGRCRRRAAARGGAALNGKRAGVNRGGARRHAFWFLEPVCRCRRPENVAAWVRQAYGEDSGLFFALFGRAFKTRRPRR